MNKYLVSKNSVESIKALEGIYRKTLVYNSNIMLCHFFLKKNAEVPLHNHKEHQVGYVIKGKLKFFTEKREFIAKEGDSYIFNSNLKHGAIILEDSEIIDVFSPAREDYK
ncbi:MAG: cupin domain-containing protein [Candidatus Hodarchaeota archaeon]